MPVINQSRKSVMSRVFFDPVLAQMADGELEDVLLRSCLAVEVARE